MDNFQAYGEFARVYDMFQDNVDYQTWGKWLKQQLAAQGITDGLVLDLGCGTGTMTEILAEAGYDMIGVDNSGEMLAEAMEKRVESGHDILYLLQDMREFELYGTVRAVVSVCDSVNYITEPEELREVFRLVNNYLDPGGIFLFDFNTEYKYREVMGDCTIAEDRGDCSFIWDNCYYEEERINEYDLTLFIREGAGSGRDESAEEEREESREEDQAENREGNQAENREGNGALYRKYCETHFQRGYTLEEIRELINSAGLVFEAAHDMETHGEATETSERICVIARENGKMNKRDGQEI